LELGKIIKIKAGNARNNKAIVKTVFVFSGNAEAGYPGFK
jgi:hypothetical protein